MPDEKPLKPEDFSVAAEGKQVKKQDGTPVALTPDPAVAEDIADRLNEDDARREEESGRLGRTDASRTPCRPPAANCERLAIGQSLPHRNLMPANA